MDFELKPEKDVELKPVKHGALEPEKYLEVKPEKEVELKPVIDVELKSAKDVELEPAKAMELKLAKDVELNATKMVEDLKLVKDTQEMKSKLNALELKLSQAEVTILKLMDTTSSAKLEQRRNLQFGFGSLPQPKTEYQIVVQPVPDDNDEHEEKTEEDRLARGRAEEEAHQQALLRKRSKVLQRGLPRPPLAPLELIRNSLIKADGDRNSFVPPTPIEQADEMVKVELLSLLEHDDAKYPLTEKVDKRN